MEIITLYEVYLGHKQYLLNDIASSKTDFLIKMNVNCNAEIFLNVRAGPTIYG